MRVRIATLAELPEGKGTAIEAGSHALVLFRVGAQVYALRNRCSHAGAPLSLGRLRGTELTCAWHGWMFDVTFDVMQYPVTIEGNESWADVPDAKPAD